MKKLITTIVSICLITAVQAYDFTVGGIYYTITSSTAPYTVAVTYGSSIYSGSVVIPSTVTNSKNGITYSVTRIESAFQNCTGTISVTIPNSVTSISENAFQNSTGLKSITIPSSVTIIEMFAFIGCTGLTSVVFNSPSALTTIERSVFDGCKGLTSVTIPNSVKTIGDYAFNDCTALASVTIPNSVLNIGDFAFKKTAWLGNQSDEFVIVNNVLLEYTGTTNNILTLPNSITSIGGGAFDSHTELTSIIIPSSVTTIGESAFNGCTGLASITIPSSVATIKLNAFYGTAWLNNQPDGFIIVNDILCAYKGDFTTINDLTIPNSVKSIGSSVFWNWTGLTSVIIPNSVINIGDFAFMGCTGLTTVTIPNSVTDIGESAFFQCSGLTSVNISSSVKNIGLGAFANCSKLTSITIPASVTNIGSYTFAGCSDLKSIYAKSAIPVDLSSLFYVFSSVDNQKCILYIPIGSKSLYALAAQWKDFVKIVEIPEINWATPTAITYGTALSTTQLNATTSIAGTFVYLPVLGTVLNAGKQTLLTTFTPSDTINYSVVSKTVTITVKINPLITWATPTDITYGTALSTTQLNATTSVSGTFGYTPAKDSILNVGKHTLHTMFTPTDTAKYNIVTDSVIINIIAPSITLSINSIIAKDSAQNNYITITSNAAWTITSSASWVTVSSTSGTGNKTITLNTSANTDSISRTATITITAQGVTKTIAVTQAGKSTTAVAEVTDEVVLYPNPAKSHITITGASGTVQIYNAMGVILLETTKTDIDVSTLPKGMYYVKAGTLVKPLIIQ